MLIIFTKRCRNFQLYISVYLGVHSLSEVVFNSPHCHDTSLSLYESPFGSPYMSEPSLYEPLFGLPLLRMAGGAGWGPTAAGGREGDGARLRGNLGVGFGGEEMEGG